MSASIFVNIGFQLLRANIRLSWWLSGIELAYQNRSCGFDPWVRKIPWRRKWQPTTLCLPGKSHGQGSLAGCSPRGCEKAEHDLAIKQQQHSKCQGVWWLGGVVRVCLVLEKKHQIAFQSGCITLHSHCQ